jgi:hypothetical protein
MLIDQYIPRYNIRILNFDFILKNTLTKFNEDIQLYGIDSNFKYRDVQKLFINSLIVTVCERVKLLRNAETIAIYVNSDTLLLPHDERDVIFKIIHKTLKKLPFQFIISEITVDYFLDRLHNNDVETVVMLESQLYYSSNFDVLKFSFKSLLKFLKSYELVYLYNIYFKQIGNKMLVIK